jgi:hypothetical protein
MEPPVPMPPPAFPQVPVLFVYVDGGEIGKTFHALCSSVPRVGELVVPQAGSPSVIVHAVTYRAQMTPWGIPGMIPQVFLRELTVDEKKHAGSIFDA